MYSHMVEGEKNAWENRTSNLVLGETKKEKKNDMKLCTHIFYEVDYPLIFEFVPIVISHLEHWNHHIKWNTSADEL